MPQTPPTPCILCRLVADANEATRIVEFRYSVAMVNFEQGDYPGYSLLILKGHYDHVHDVPRELFHAFMDERTLLATAIIKAYPATMRMNYANLGNAVSHVHEHVIPRHANDHNAGGPPWPMNRPPQQAPEAYRAIAAKIRAAMQK